MGKARKHRLVLGMGCAAMLLLGACGDDDDTSSSRDGGTDSGTNGPPRRDSGPAPLPDGTAGKACTSNADCEGGTCATQVTGIGLAATPNAAPGGYCTAMCTTDADCGGDGACVIAIGATLSGQCFATCDSVADCREGYQCGGGFMLAGIVVPNTCRPAPETDQLEDGVVGDMCSSADECPGGMCLTSRTGLIGNSTELPGGYCSGRCLEDAHCGESGVCLQPLLGGAGSCYQACTTDDDCTREGYRCRLLNGQVRGCNPAPDPLPDNTTGNACTGDADCGGGTGTCQSELPASGFGGLLGQTVPAPGGYCSQACAEDSDCGAGGLCTGALGGGYCFKPCTSLSDCRDGYLCDDRSLGGGNANPMPSDAGTSDGGAGTSDGGASPAMGTVCTPQPPPDEDAGAG